MKPTLEHRCLMVPLSNQPCPSGEGLEHACMESAGHDGRTHRCECGYMWTERRLPVRATRSGPAVRRWIARAAVLAICAAGFAGWYSSRGDLDRAQRSTELMHRALFYFGYDCSYQSTSDALECMPVKTISPSTSTSTQEDQ